MRILHVITSLNIGGAERLMTTLLPQLDRLGNDVELLVFDSTRTSFTETLEKEGIRIHSLNARRIYSPLNIWKLRKFLKGYDIIHTHNTACQLFIPIVKVLFLDSKVMLLTTEHSTSNRRRGKWYFRGIDRWMYSRYEKVICIGESTEENLKKDVMKDIKTQVIHNGICIPDINTKCVSNANVVISMVAAFRNGKDQDCLVRALKLLPKRFRLKLIGDGERKGDVENLASMLNLNDRVEFLGNRSDVNELLQESDINVLASHWEGLSLSSLECMASGRPFIASDVQGLHEIVNGYGILFPDSDHEALAKEIESIVSDPKKYMEVSERCRRRALDFDIKVTAEKYNEVYQATRKGNDG